MLVGTGTGRVSERWHTIVTGVADPAGIGFGSAQVLARKGARLSLVDISSEVHARAAELREQGANATSHRVDLTLPDGVRDLVADVTRDHPVDALVNLAGIAARTTNDEYRGPETPLLHETTDDVWDRTLSLNLSTQFLLLREVLPHMMERRYGRIVNFSSVTGPVAAIEGLAGYAAAKAGVLGLTRAVALEYGRFGITANAVAPGWIRTGALTPEMAAGGTHTPVGRCGEPAEVGALVAFLAGEESSYVSGQLIIVDGGNTIQEYRGPDHMTLA